MKPKPFDYVKPVDLDEALRVLKDAEGSAKVLAGGQSLVPMLNMRLAQPDLLVDINEVPGLDHTAVEDGVLRIGAMVRHQALVDGKVINDKLPVVAEAARHIGHRAIRNRGTIGGSLVHNDPCAELGVVLSCLGAEVVLQSSTDGARVVSLDDFFVTTFLTDLRPSEVLTEVRIPIPPQGWGYAFKELTKRAGDFAIVAAACLMETDASRKVTQVSLALGGAADCPSRFDLADVLVGEELTDRVLARSVDTLVNQIDPSTDNVASGEYKKHLAGELTRQCLAEAYQLSIRD